MNTNIQPVFVSRKIDQELNVKEAKPSIVNEQCVVYKYQCDLCDAGYIGYTRGHLHNVLKDINNSPQALPNIARTYTGRSLRTNKETIRPNLNTQSDSIRAKLFV